MKSGTYRDGMHAPGECIEWTIAAPPGVSLATGTLALSVVMTAKGTTRTLTNWVFTNRTATSVVATYLPDGTEFTGARSATFRPTLTIGGVAYRYPTMNETVEAY